MQILHTRPTRRKTPEFGSHDIFVTTLGVKRRWLSSLPFSVVVYRRVRRREAVAR